MSAAVIVRALEKYERPWLWTLHLTKVFFDVVADGWQSSTVLVDQLIEYCGLLGSREVGELTALTVFDHEKPMPVPGTSCDAGERLKKSGERKKAAAG